MRVYPLIAIVLLLAAVDKAPAQQYTVLDTIQDGSLTIYLIGSDRPGISRHYLTLDEAIKTHRATLRETGTTNLQLENHSNQDIFVQSASIVKGGQQDRMLANDLIVAASSEPIAVPAYCVEHDRSFQRGSEPLSEFSTANELAPLARMRVLAKKPFLVQATSANSSGDGFTAPRDSVSHQSSVAQEQALLNQLSWYENQNAFQLTAEQKALQESIWSDVRDIQHQLSDRMRHSVQSSISPSSLELSLEDSTLHDESVKQVTRIGDLMDRSRSKPVVGIAYAVGGKLRGAEIYGSSELFMQEWPTVLQAIVTEGMVANGAVQTVNPDRNQVLEFLERKSGTPVTQDLSVRERVIAYESGGLYRFETEDRLEASAPIHVSILTSDRN